MGTELVPKKEKRFYIKSFLYICGFLWVIFRACLSWIVRRKGSEQNSLPISLSRQPAWYLSRVTRSSVERADSGHGDRSAWAEGVFCFGLVGCFYSSNNVGI